MSQTPIPARMVDEVMIRDGHRPDAVEIDHIVPESRRGMTTVDNLQTLCRACH